ncbi:ATP synthase subunit delta, sodium ion specific [Fusobacterium sp. DD29]|uniref:ATP synthase F1 subunit delta n=1 Tax=unclassified Fusobacterium TaxID=2648384 RepID=UPI001B8BCB6F|nr:MULTISPECIES: ATP synthase F1 subunit delta [unclassified Fusobacterium]MBR8700873.1 ATP synthase subunit delta, sodium ion specific [Fusobacterium sp. DD45]MBR8710663.1 ATP synthase subunit delta, sodium ion specific [Fusobacterium sp. DD28]MBR8748842.1 ATP synthase subunit delta, sodium ion specific [Fusobacterium sp. DD29]MBR8751223.1 ATP synthase subunit delta, sodium ion specific [Fusobacterium sp. DD26]MBR8761109.1 ATP synthase subunit delta, sodium ion specific [Fusobacterium sp. DD2
MIANQVGNRYAEAIYEIAESTGKIKEVYEVLNNLMELYKKDTDFRTFITHPLIDIDEKKKFLKDMYQSADEQVLDIVFYIMDKKRMRYIRSIVAEYLKIYYFNHQIVDVEATFAVEPTKAQQDKLIANLEKKTGKKVKLAIKIDKSIIGGGILRMGDTVMDGSIRKELEALKRN